MRALGIDLAWADSGEEQPNETGVVAVAPSGEVLDAGWTVGVSQTADWMGRWAGDEDAIAFVDAPLVVNNDSGLRLCERQVGQKYGSWKVSANSTNRASPRLAGVKLLSVLEEKLGWHYDDGRSGPPISGRVVSECYPYTTLVGAVEFGHPDQRPLYKRKPKRMRVADFRPLRAIACDGIIAALKELSNADPPIDLMSHETTARLVSGSSPVAYRDYKHREDLIDAVICAWTAMLWLRHGLERCQVLGIEDDVERAERLPTIIAPMR